MLRTVLSVIAFLFGGAALSSAHAGLRFIPDTTEGGHQFVVVTGDFAYEDDLSAFVAVVRAHRAVAVAFNSPGGNVAKAMELGRLIRSEGLVTIQSRGSECASACALAFLGGLQRFAQPGSIGVHRSSFSDTRSMSVDDAVSHIQRLTADIMAYISEMGADPALLQLALQYASGDMRYLSLSEGAVPGDDRQLRGRRSGGEARCRRAGPCNTTIGQPPYAGERALRDSGSTGRFGATPEGSSCAEVEARQRVEHRGDAEEWRASRYSGQCRPVV
ncbi:hypothetical protein ABIA23_005431 [Sinorhizobium fredii]